MKKQDIENIRKWRQRGYYSERALVKKLQRYGYNAVRIPMSNPSKLPLPDIIGRKNNHIYAFEVKNANYSATYNREQIVKLFEYLDQFHTNPNEQKHAVLIAHLGRLWKGKEINWRDFLNSTIPEKVRISRKSRSLFNIRKGISKYPNT